MGSPHGDESDPPRLAPVVDAVAELGEKQAEVSIRDVYEELGQRSFGPFLFVPAIIELSPIGGIPGVPSLLALIVLIAAVQMLFGRERFWIPAFIAKRAIKGERVEAALRKMQPLVRFLDRIAKPRWGWAIRKPWSQVVAALCIFCAVSVPPLELIPFASSAPFSAIALVGLGLIGKDGALVLLGAVLSMGTGYLLYVVLPG